MAGLDDLVNKAKSLAQGDKNSTGAGDSVLDKVKQVATDERVDQVSEHIQKIAPDSLDPKVQALAEQAKKFNN